MAPPCLASPLTMSGAPPADYLTNAVIGAGFLAAGDAKSPQDIAISKAREVAQRGGVQLDPRLEAILGRQFGSEYGAPLSDADVAAGIEWSKLSPLERLAATSRPTSYPGPVIYPDAPAATPQSIQAERDALVNGTNRVEDLRQNVPQTATAAEAGRARSPLYKTYQDLLDKGMSRSSAGKIAFGDDWENKLSELEKPLQPGEAQPDLVREKPTTPNTFVPKMTADEYAQKLQEMLKESTGHPVTVTAKTPEQSRADDEASRDFAFGVVNRASRESGSAQAEDARADAIRRAEVNGAREPSSQEIAASERDALSALISPTAGPEIRNALRARGEDPDALIAKLQERGLPVAQDAPPEVAPVAEKAQVQPAGTPATSPVNEVAPVQPVGSSAQVPTSSPVGETAPIGEQAVAPNATPEFKAGDVAHVTFNRKSGPVVEPHTISQVVDGVPYWRDEKSGEQIPIKPDRIVKVEPRESVAPAVPIDMGADTDSRAREWVKSAIARGEEIPPDVLAAYPDLAKEAGQEPAAVGGVGPGTKRAGESEDPREQIQQLTQTLDNLKSEMRPKPVVPEVQGRSLSDIGADARAKVVEAGAKVWRKYTGLPDYTEADYAFGKWLGSQAKSGIMSYDFSQAIKKAIPDKITREAMTIWIESHPTLQNTPDGKATIEGDSDLIKYWRDNGARAQDPALGAAYQRALELTPDEKTFALNVKNYFDAVLDQAKKAGVLDKGIEDYVTHIWNLRRGEQSNVGGLLGGVNPTKGRVLPTWAQGEDLGYRGNKDIGNLVTAYQQAIGRKIANTYFVDALLNSKAQDGKPLAVKGESRPPFYEPSTAPGFNGIYLHPEIAKRLNNATGVSGIRQSTVGKALLDFERGVKETMVAVSPFHPVQLTVHAAEHRVNLFDLREPSLNDPDYSALLDHSFVPLGGNPRGEFTEGLGSGAGVFKYIPKLGGEDRTVPELDVGRGRKTQGQHGPGCPSQKQGEVLREAVRRSNSSPDRHPGERRIWWSEHGVPW